MSYKLNFSYKNEKENSIKLLLLEHHLNNQNVKKKDKLSVYNSLYLKDKVDNDKVTGVIVRAFRNPNNIGYRYYIQVYNKGKKTERVIEIKGNTVKFAEGGEHGNISTKTKYKNSEIVDKGYNSKTVYNSSELGLETTGG